MLSGNLCFSALRQNRNDLIDTENTSTITRERKRDEKGVRESFK